jgi:hypothetical protein
LCIGWRSQLDQSEQPACTNARFYSTDGRPGNSLDIARPFLLVMSAIAVIRLMKAAISRLS